ncbi:MAG: protein kinase [Lacunisphaera sp.]|nr:protein kinase [Lacunisphaera sp.]
MNTCPTCSLAYDPAATGGPCPRCSLAGALAAAANAGPADYEFLSELGRGGMGVVSLVRQRSLDRLVALKVIAATGDATAPARLLKEARAAAAIAHPHVVAVHEVGQGESGAFIAMEYCEGGDLRTRLQSGPLAPRAAAELVRKLADAIARAHAAGVLHRDLKPSNVLLTAAGEPKLSDFGLSGSIAGAASEHTRTGTLAGTPSYLAPELLAGGAATPAVDIYGLGAILYECVTGRPPFTGDSPAAVLAQIGTVEPVPPRRLSPAVPADLDTIILKCLEKDPAARYAGAAALEEDLGNFLAGRPIHARPPSPAGRLWRWARRNPALAGSSAAALLLLVVLAIGSSLAAWRLDRERDRALVGEHRAWSAETATRTQLRAALLAQAHATRLTGREGQRFNALAALGEAAAIRPAADARSEAVAALTLPDWSARVETSGLWTENSPHTATTPLPGFGAFIHETDTGVFSRRTFAAGKIAWTWPGVGSPRAGATVVSPDGRWVAARLQNDEIHVLDAVTGAPSFKLTGRPFAFKASRIWGYGTDLAFSADGSLFAATRPEGGVTIHRLPDGQQTTEWITPEWITSLAFARSGTRLAIGGSKERGTNVLAVIDAATGQALAKEASTARVDFVEWSADDRWLAVGTKPLQVRAARDLTLRATLPEYSALHARFLPDGRRLLISEQIGQTRLWDIDRARLLLTKADSGRPGVWFDDTPLRQWRYFSGGPVVVQIFHETEIFRASWPPLREYTLPSIADPLDVSPDGRWAVLGGWQGPSLLNVSTGQWHRPAPEGAEGSLSTARFDPTGAALWTGQSKGPLRRHPFSVDSGTPVVGSGEIIPGHDGFLPTALHPGTGRLALADYHGGRYRLLDTRTRAVVAEWPMPRACYATFSPDGRLLLTSPETSPDAQGEIREVSSGRLVKVLSETAGQAGAWSPDGQTVLASDGLTSAKLWRSIDWAPGPVLPAEAQGAARRAAYSPDGRLLAINENNFIWLLRADTGGEIARLEAPEQNRFSPSLRFTPDGGTLIVPRLDGSVHLWSLAAIRTELGKLGLDWQD